MANPATAYQRAILQARSRGFALTREALAAITIAFRDAARAIEHDLDTSSSPVTLGRARELRTQALAIIHELELRAIGTVNQSVRTTVRDLLQIHQDVTRSLLRQEGVATILSSTARLDVRTLAVLAARRGRAATFQTLVHRNVLEAAPALDRLVNAAVVRGVPIRTLTRDIADLLARAEGADLTTYELSDSAVTGLRTLWSDARRISTSETLNALRESQALAMADSPIVQAVKWQTSGNHPGEDECLGGDVLVSTARGLRRIDEVRVGDVVLSHRGRWRRVLAISCRPLASRVLRQVTCRGETNHTQAIVATLNHPVLTPGGWREVGDLRTGMRIRSVPGWLAAQLRPLFGDTGSRGQQDSERSAPARLVGISACSRCGAFPSVRGSVRIARSGGVASSGPTPRKPYGEVPTRYSVLPATSGFLAPADVQRTARASPAAFASGLRGMMGHGIQGSSTAAVLLGGRCRIASDIGRTPESFSGHGLRRTDTAASKTVASRIGTPSSFVESAFRSTRNLVRDSGSSSAGHCTDDYKTALLGFEPDSAVAQCLDSPGSSSSEKRSVRMAWSYIKDIVDAPRVPYVYNLKVAVDESYVANGLVVHNCDLLEQTDFYGFGEGFYPPEAFPVAPHPNCGCTQGEVQMRPVEDWGSPREAAEQVSGLDDVALPEGWSPVRSDRALTTIRASLADPIGRRSRAA